ncbi:MAG: ABC transporter permease [Alphaproteobacteria bacterium]
MENLKMKKNKDLIGQFAIVIIVFILSAIFVPNFLSLSTLHSMAFQMPELGLLTLAMFLPILTGGLNLAITYTANLAGLLMAVLLMRFTSDISSTAIIIFIFMVGFILAMILGFILGAFTGGFISYIGAHPILVTLGMMMLLRGVGVFLTKGGDISGLPEVISWFGHGTILSIPVPLIIFLVVTFIVHVILTYTPFGIAVYMVGSSEPATRYSGVDTKKIFVLLYGFSGLISAIAGMVMLARFNSVRAGHGESYILITVLACFLGGVNPYGGFGKTFAVLFALITLQIITTSLNTLLSPYGNSQHLASAIWGVFLIGIMIFRQWTGGMNISRLLYLKTVK